MRLCSIGTKVTTMRSNCALSSFLCRFLHSIVVTPQMQYPPLSGHAGIYQINIKCKFPLSSGVSPIPFPLCAMLEGTHGTASQVATLGTHIDRYRSLVMSLVRQRKEQHPLAHLYCTHKAPTRKRQAN